MFTSDRGSARVVFNVPAAAGTFAPEALYLKNVEQTTPDGLMSWVYQLRVLVESLIATAVAEIQVLPIGADPRSEAAWVPSGLTMNAVGLWPQGTNAQFAYEMAGCRGVRLKVKSGGTAGPMPITAFWH